MIINDIQNLLEGISNPQEISSDNKKRIKQIIGSGLVGANALLSKKSSISKNSIWDKDGNIKFGFKDSSIWDKDGNINWS